MNNSSTKRIIFMSLSLMLVVTLIGCAAKRPTPSGFLRDYTFMIDADPEETFFIEENVNRHRGKYSKVLLKPTIMYFHPEAKGAAIDPDKLKELANFFYIEVVDSIKDDYEIVDKPAVDVLTIRTAITDVMAAKPYLNIHWTTTFAGFGLGGATVEIEFLDSLTNERVLAIVDSRLGERSLKPKKYTRGWKKWGHTEDILNGWAGLLKEHLDSLK